MAQHDTKLIASGTQGPDEDFEQFLGRISRIERTIWTGANGHHFTRRRKWRCARLGLGEIARRNRLKNRTAPHQINPSQKPTPNRSTRSSSWKCLLQSPQLFVNNLIYDYDLSITGLTAWLTTIMILVPTKPRSICDRFGRVRVCFIPSFPNLVNHLVNHHFCHTCLYLSFVQRPGNARHICPAIIPIPNPHRKSSPHAPNAPQHTVVVKTPTVQPTVQLC